jgi:hypothetical protein
MPSVYVYQKAVYVDYTVPIPVRPFLLQLPMLLPIIPVLII